MPSDEAITNLQERLVIHRRNLAHSLKQQTQMGSGNATICNRSQPL